MCRGNNIRILYGSGQLTLYSPWCRPAQVYGVSQPLTLPAIRSKHVSHARRTFIKVDVCLSGTVETKRVLDLDLLRSHSCLSTFVHAKLLLTHKLCCSVRNWRTVAIGEKFRNLTELCKVMELHGFFSKRTFKSCVTSPQFHNDNHFLLLRTAAFDRKF